MKSSFFEFNVAISGLFTAKAGLETVSHNVANASTKGYSRQVVLQRANVPLSLYDGRGMVGTGSEVYGITQVRDVYLDKRYWGGQSTLGEYSMKRSQLFMTQTVMSELEGTGLTTMFNSLFDSIQDLITNTGDITYRTNVLQSAESLSTFFKDTYETLLKQQSDINEEVRAMISTINTLGSQIHTLNEKIRVVEANGDHANDLRDQRALLVDELSRYVDVDAYEVDHGGGDKRYFVKINGQDFVMNNNLRLLTCRERSVMTTVTENDPITGLPVTYAKSIDTYRNPEDNAGLLDIYWGETDTKFDVYNAKLTGQLKGLIDVRDGNSGLFASFSSTAATYTPGASYGDPSTLTVPAALMGRYDLAPSGGVLRIQDSLTGQIREYAYDSFEIDATGNAVFSMAYGDAAKKAEIDSYFNNLNAGSNIAVGVTNEYKGIPYYLNRLNTLARTFASAVNFGTKLNGDQLQGVIGHVDGYNLNGTKGADDDILKTLFFTFTDKYGNIADYTTLNENPGNFSIYQITARNLQVNPDLIKKPHLLNASDDPTGGRDNNNVLLSLLNINSDPTLFSEGRLLDYIVGMTGELAIDVKQATNFEKNYDALTVQIDNQRLSISGVSINEEIADMIRYNQQYQAASRLINIIDGIYDTLCNRLGYM